MVNLSSSQEPSGASVSTVRMVEQDQHHGRHTSKVVATGCSWKSRGDGMLLLEMISSRLGCFQGKTAHSYRQQPKGTPTQAKQQRKSAPSPWVCFVRKLALLNCGSSSKVQALHSDWLNYDSHSYALNFEKDIVLEAGNHYRAKFGGHMPTISGPGARDIITALLRRSSSANRNCGSHLIPKPVFLKRHERRQPLWKRRRGQEPPHLDIKGRHQRPSQYGVIAFGSRTLPRI